MWGLKTFGRGLISILISPLILLLIAIMGVYALIVYLFYEISSIYLFFLGKNYNSDDEETVLVKQAMAGIEPGYYRVDQNLAPGVTQQPPSEPKDDQSKGDNNV